ncbi:muconolactone Delta-isomerase [Amycolatopsis sp. CA-126428]|uniref:muconolactone Delta-isomerase n=1 Tax=Amycolatopsis sp. CA-126428 TaxID=2073158 RepID=UPI000CD278A2|nr:muconolactone Delta-isomerase family protein [Amycolatopsis sp. CA-126428]
MLFHVRMDVTIPPGLDVTDRVAEEKARALELQRASVWVHLWRIVGYYSNFSVFDVASNDELHGILSSLPLYPFMRIEVTPLATHPSDLAAQ